jgi:DNA (cytosine-5)-methyltransferase 1
MKDLPEHLQHESFQRRAFRRVMDGTPVEKRGGAPSGLKRLFANEPSLTITSTATREFVHPAEDRLLTLRECARLQTFIGNRIISMKNVHILPKNAIIPQACKSSAN